MIDLKKTIDEAGIRQSHLAVHFGISKQHINKYYKTNKMSKGWIIAFTQYFNMANIKIYKTN